nr:MAG TPA: Lysozyme [Caudoviricetes sp.]
MSNRTLSKSGMELIKKFEGCNLTAYKVQESDEYYTIGYGHYGSDVGEGQTITDEEATSLLYADCDRFVTHVNKYMSNYNFNQNQFDALVSFAYNVGNIITLTQNGAASIEEISADMLLYCKSNGVTLRGLVNRRKAEQELFNTPIQSSGKSVEELAKEVIAGKWGNGAEREEALSAAGYDYNAIQKMVGVMLDVHSDSKSVEELAKEVIAGKWGNGAEREEALSAAGFDYSTIQSAVNTMLGAQDDVKSVEELAKEVIAGKWGNGETRKESLAAAGYDYNAVQTLVNEMLKGE